MKERQSSEGSKRLARLSILVHCLPISAYCRAFPVIVLVAAFQGRPLVSIATDAQLPPPAEAVDPAEGADCVASIYRRDLAPLAATSCSATSCHGGPQAGVADPRLAGDSAYTLWFQSDPHARSWESICGPEGVAMMRRLRIVDGDRIVDVAGFNNCLACHNSHLVPTAPAALAEFRSQTHAAAVPENTDGVADPEHTEGVACSSCHGPAEKWIHSHYSRGWDPAAASDEGYMPNDSFVVRARMCASCHVGDHDRDMNHDLIAAGHPALRFEMASHHARLPKHWRDKGEEDWGRHEAALWAAGAIASADAWLSLQQGRATKKTAVSTWPELSAYDCGSCHQHLRLQEGPSGPSIPGAAFPSVPPLSQPQTGQLGKAKVALWDLAPLIYLANLPEGSFGASFEGQRQPAIDASRVIEGLGVLRVEMGKLPGSSAGEVDALVTRLKGELAALATEIEPSLCAASPPDLVVLLGSVAGTADPSESWDTAAQFYLLMAASQHVWPAGGRGELIDQARAIRRGLAFPPGVDSARYALGPTAKIGMGRQEMAQRVNRFVDTLRVTQGRWASETGPASIPLAPTSIDPERSVEGVADDNGS